MISQPWTGVIPAQPTRFAQPCHDLPLEPDTDSDAPEFTPEMAADMEAMKEQEQVIGQAQYRKKIKLGDKLADELLKAEEEKVRKLVAISLNDIDEQETRWVWQDRIPFGEITLIAGKGGVGKSTLLAQFAAWITRGTAPGDLYGKPSSVLYVANEDDLARTVKPRFVSAGADMDRIHIVRPERDEMGRIDMTRDCERFAALAREYGASVLMFDPLSSNLGAGKKNDQDDMRRVFEAMQRMATANNLAIVGLAHTRKGASGDLLESIMGSSEQGNVCRSAMGVARDPEDPSRCILSQEKSNLSAGHRLESYSFTIEETYYTSAKGVAIKSSRIGDIRVSEISVGDVINESGDGGKGAEARDWLEEFLTKQGRTTKKAVLEEGKKARHSVRTLERAAASLCTITRLDGPGRPAIWELKGSPSPSASPSAPVSPSPVSEPPSALFGDH